MKTTEQLWAETTRNLPEDATLPEIIEAFRTACIRDYFESAEPVAYIVEGKDKNNDYVVRACYAAPKEE